MSITAELWKLRFFQIVFITTIPLFWFVVLNIPNERATSWHWLQVLPMAYALFSVCTGFYMRARCLRCAIPVLQVTPDDPKAMRQWRTGQLIGISSAEAVLICGIFNRLFLNSSLWMLLVFSAVCLTVLIIWTPRLPPGVKCLRQK